MHASVHTNAYHHSIGTQRTATIEVPNARTEFNVYAVEWTPEDIRAYVNDRHFFTFENERLGNPDAGQEQWPFDHPFHYVLNVAVGGTWGGQEVWIPTSGRSGWRSITSGRSIARDKKHE